MLNMALFLNFPEKSRAPTTEAKSNTKMILLIINNLIPYLYLTTDKETLKKF